MIWIYNWYVDGDHLLLRFILGRGAFRNDINDKCILCKIHENSQEHVINDCTITEKLRLKLIKELNELDNESKIKHFWIVFITGIIVKIQKIKKKIIKV